MRYLRGLALCVVIAGVGLSAGVLRAAQSGKLATQEYVDEQMPTGFQIVNSELEGPVFANAAGLTLYIWPRSGMRVGTAGDQPGEPSHCTDIPSITTAGFTSPFPGDLQLPEADHRPTCMQHWPPVLAAQGARPIGKWTIVERADGKKQWARDGFPLYTSHLDHHRGETNGGSLRRGWDNISNGAPREPAIPEPLVPTQFSVAAMFRGRMLTTRNHESVYAFDGDTATRSSCNDRCVEKWRPLLAPEAALVQGPWNFAKRMDGQRQWTYRGMPLYTHVFDTKLESFEGSDVPGWHNVFMQLSPGLPKNFQLVDTRAGQVAADAKGKTIYIYSCVEDTVDTLYCNSPDAPQQYRWAMCGGGDPQKCLQMFPYVNAEENAKSDSLAWSVIYINPMTGRLANAGDASALRVWAYRGRPVYTFSGDREPGDIEADSWGQDHGQRNGFKAIWYRDDFRHNDGSDDYRPV